MKLLKYLFTTVLALITSVVLNNATGTTLACMATDNVAGFIVNAVLPQGCATVSSGVWTDEMIKTFRTAAVFSEKVVVKS